MTTVEMKIEQSVCFGIWWVCIFRGGIRDWHQCDSIEEAAQLFGGG